MDALWEAAAPYLRARKNDVHIPLSYGFAERLLEAYDGDPAVVLPAILLHDCGWAVVDHQVERVGPAMHQSDMRRAHEIEGARIARELLTEHVEEIATIIDGHDSRPRALSLDDALVKDADKLWRYTTAGVAVGCDWFAMTPREYADWVDAERDRVIFTDVAKEIAREEMTTTRRALRI
jgi:HD superfamily phosphodiesterase